MTITNVKGRGSLLSTGHMSVPFGINVVAPASAIPETDGLIVVNMIAGDRGLKPRPGYQEWCTGVGSGEVRSIIPFHGSQASKDRLFATTSTVIKNCTTSSAAPSTVHTFGTSNSDTGWGVYTSMANATDHYLIYTDEANGCLVYNEAADTWAAASITGGLAAADAVFCAQWRHHLFLVKKNTAEAYFLATGVLPIGGAATTKIDFGPLFPHGGSLVGLWIWTVDGGAGADDFLVAISTSGDVVAFAGTDPTPGTGDLTQLGEWFTGGVPAYRRIATQFGGDILILTNLGILPLSKLISGQLVTPDTYETYKIRPHFQTIISQQASSRGWEMLIHPGENFLLLNTPGAPGESQEQLAMSYSTKGWSRLRNQDMLSAAIWNRTLYFGTRTGIVMKSTGYMDKVSRDGSTGSATPVQAHVLSAFQHGGSANRKMVRWIRPMFETHGVNPNVTAFARYDYDTAELTATIPISPLGTGLWDTGVWDTAMWSNNAGTFKAVRGATGIGSAIAMAALIDSQDYTILVGWDYTWEEMGAL